MQETNISLEYEVFYKHFHVQYTRKYTFDINL